MSFFSLPQILLLKFFFFNTEILISFKTPHGPLKCLKTFVLGVEAGQSFGV